MSLSTRFKDIIISLFAGKEKMDEGISISSLAYIGDSLFDLYIRLYLLEEYPGLSVEFLHRRSVQYSNPNSQHLVLARLFKELPPEEKRVVERARRDLKRVPSHIHLLDYQSATALESLLGYLFLKKDFQRLLLLLSKIIQETKIYAKEL